MKFVSLFSGVGGFDLGFERAGMECVAQVEIDAKCREVLAQHWPDVTRHEDVKEVSFERGTVDLVCGGFPCQDLSVAGRRAGLAGERSGLWHEFHRILAETRPEWAVIENVPGLLSSNGGRDFAIVLRGLVELGYGVVWRILDAQYFGVAQRRRRVFIVSHLGDGAGCWQRALFDEKGCAGDNPSSVGEKKPVGNYPPDEISWWDGRGLSQTLDAVLYKKQAMPEKQRFPAVIVPAWVECEMCEDYWCQLHSTHVADCPCPAVEDWVEEGLYPYAPSVLRFLTPVECCRLQGFPDNWNASQSDTTRYRQMGNAVCVPVAEWIGRRIVALE